MKHLFVTIALIVVIFNFDDVAKAAKPRGSYTFPSDKSLGKYANWPLRVKNIVNNAKNISVTYLLPNNVTGHKTIEVTMKGTKQAGAFFKISGLKGEGTCTESKKHITCLVKFKGLGINSKDVSKFLTKKFSDMTERTSRLKIAKAYSSEPIGVLMIEK